MWTQKHEDELEEKPDLSVLNNQTHHFPMRPQILHDKRQRQTIDDKRRRVDEPGSPISPVAQNKAPILNPVSFHSETRNEEIAVDVPLLEEPAKVSGQNDQSWITEEASFTVSLGVRQVRHCHLQRDVSS